MKLREFGKFKEFNNEKILGFRNYIEEAWNKRYCLYDDSELYDNNLINKQQFLIFDGNKIKAKNYVGFISYEGEEVTIYPKVFEENIDNDILDKYLMTNLMYWMKRSKRIKIPMVNTEVDLQKYDSFLEVLINIFSKYTFNLIYSKPYNCYEEIQEEVTYLKGRLNINRYLKENISTGKWNKFNTIHEPFLYNNKFNQIIKFVSKKLLNITEDKESKELINKIIFILDDIDNICCNEYSCNEVKLNRLQDDYEIVLNFCDIFLKSTSLWKNNKEDKINFCFLIPMEILFEDFVFNFMKEKFNDKYKEITAQKSNLYLAQVMVDDKPLSNVFRLKQDIFLRDLNNNVTILDTKYKLLNKSEDKKYGISQSDMYQMCSYALRGGYNNLALVYPRVDNFNKDITYKINSGFNDELIEIKVIMIDYVLSYEKFMETDRRKIELHEFNDKNIERELIYKLNNEVDENE